MFDKAAWRSLRTCARTEIHRSVDLTVEGLDQVPPSGPVILAARHYHHLYDGCAILATIPRQTHVLVGLDWIERPFALRGMKAACRSARWPVVFRDTDSIERAIWAPMLRTAIDESLGILRDGRVLLVFPEGYPTIDPHGSRKSGPDDFLPFRPGFARIALDAWRAGLDAPVVPVGLSYRQGERWSIAVRFGGPIAPRLDTDVAALSSAVQERVQALSRGGHGV